MCCMLAAASVWAEAGAATDTVATGDSTNEAASVADSRFCAQFEGDSALPGWRVA